LFGLLMCPGSPTEKADYLFDIIYGDSGKNDIEK
jgi:hypothetical protein